MEELSKNKIKLIRSLQQKKYRDENDLFVIEGVKMCQEALQYCPNQIQLIVHTQAFEFKAPHANIEQYVVHEKILKQCSSLKNPNHVLMLVKKIAHKKEDGNFTIALDGVQDPGNMGTIMRLADWYGVNKIVCSNATVDCYNPKVVQATMGAILRIPIAYVDLKEYLSNTTSPIYGALLDGENIYSKTMLPEGILLLGNEGNGISEELIPLITHPITIPKAGNAESLNVSIATGILLSEFFRGSLK